MKGLIIAFLSCIVFLSPNLAQDKADKLVGVWQPSEGTSYIKIDKIGNKYFGRIVWLKEPLNEQGKPKTDKNNPDESLRDTPLKGYRILKDFVYDSEEGIWKDGTIYDPKNGTTYNCKIELTEENQIEVRGYVGTAAFGRTDVWTRLVKKK
ncbi:DUF2147 domain-containing protein [Luteibaculum oceani]|uniref:DUF2147 domain-containing protein n=1 Tax=Luteibaculum oceani TaxID=1294296 RepID=A0A5C6VJG9_9FLAO|nr:DUF2147 domain-containing protein [Luteibaculum oceani]TXC85457.1 DUF2147 domain-containing protein [Luteibaculum oceani]